MVEDAVVIFFQVNEELVVELLSLKLEFHRTITPNFIEVYLFGLLANINLQRIVSIILLYKSIALHQKIIIPRSILYKYLLVWTDLFNTDDMIVFLKKIDLFWLLMHVQHVLVIIITLTILFSIF